MAGVKKMNVEELVVMGSDDGQRGYAATRSLGHPEDQDLKKIDGQLWEIGAVKQEMRELVSSAWPMVFTMVMFYLANVITISFVGQLGALDLAAVGLASMFCNVTGISIAVGLSSGLETQAAQLYGAGQYRQVGIAAQRATVCILAALLPVAGIWAVTGPLLVAVSIDADVAHRAASFVRMMILGLPAVAVQETVRKYLQCQGVMLPFVFVSCVANVVHIAACRLFISPLSPASLGVPGAALTLVLTYYFNNALICAYCLCSGAHLLTWGGWTRECVEHVPAFLKLAVPGAGMICLEWWCFELMTLMSARLGTAVVAAQTVMFSTTAIFFMVPLGFSIAVGARVGNFLGAGKPVSAQRVAVLGVICSACITVVASLTLYGFRRQWAQMFTQDVVVIDEIMRVMPLQASFLVFDTIQGVVSGVIRGCGNQHVGFFVNLFSYYCVAMPVAVILAFFFDMGLMGLWFGLAMGAVTQASSLTFFVYRVDYQKLADGAAERCAYLSGCDEGLGAEGSKGLSGVEACGGTERSSHSDFMCHDVNTVIITSSFVEGGDRSKVLEV